MSEGMEGILSTVEADSVKVSARAIINDAGEPIVSIRVEGSETVHVVVNDEGDVELSADV